MTINWKSVGAGLVSVFGVLAANVNSLPHNLGVGITVIGIVAQLFSHPAVAKNP